jgi:hypothetical protein
MELTNKRFLIFKCYQMDVKNIKCPLQCWEKYENIFHILISLLNKSFKRMDPNLKQFFFLVFN